MKVQIILMATHILATTSAHATISFQGLGSLPPYSFSSSAYDLSADGSVVVGYYSSGQAFRWTSGGGIVALGPLDGGSSSRAEASTGDGSFIVGHSSSATGFEACRWGSGGSKIGLGDLPGGSVSSYAFDVNSDGSVIVGIGQSTESVPNWEAMRWTIGDGMVGLGDLPGGSFYSRAEGVSANGSIIVGSGNDDSGQTAIIWDATNGMQRVSDVLTAGGVDLTGWTLTSAEAISDDGTVIAGNGVSTNGTEAWIATLDLPLTGPPDTLQSVVSFSNSVFTIQLSAPSGQDVTVSSTDDLSQPFSNPVILTNTTGIVEYDDNTAGQATQRFYRTELSSE